MTGTRTDSNARRYRLTLLAWCATALALGLFLLPVSASAQDDLPHYCKTEVGVLGPYDNPGNVHVGDQCFGTKNGRRYYGTAVMGPDENGDSRKGRDKEELPRYCSTEVGVLGPYDNPGNVHVGDPCFGTKNGRRYDGTAVMGK